MCASHERSCRGLLLLLPADSPATQASCSCLWSAASVTCGPPTFALQQPGRWRPVAGVPKQQHAVALDHASGLYASVGEVDGHAAAVRHGPSSSGEPPAVQQLEDAAAVEMQTAATRLGASGGTGAAGCSTLWQRRRRKEQDEHKRAAAPNPDLSLTD